MDGILLESFPINIGPSCAAGTAGVVEGVSSAVHCNAVLGFYYPCDSHENQPPLVGVHHLILCLCLHWIKPLGFLSTLVSLGDTLYIKSCVFDSPWLHPDRLCSYFPRGIITKFPV